MSTHSSDLVTEPSPDLEPEVVIVDDALVEEIWQDMQGTATREHIRQLVLEASREFAEATITTYIAIFVRRQVRAKLASIGNDVDSADDQPINNWARVDKVEGQRDLEPNKSRFGNGRIMRLFQAIP